MKRALGALILLAACGSGDQNAGSLETFEIVGGQQRYQVDLFDQGKGIRHIIVSSVGYRGLLQTDAATAFAVASQAGEQSECANGKGVRVLPDSGLFIDQNRAGALTRGGAAWQFKGRCGG